MSEKLSNRDEIVLTGRIYPAIQSCVSNRYKIVAGYFAVLAYLLWNKTEVTGELMVLVTIFFALLVVHNAYNYYKNAKDQWELEGPREYTVKQAIFSLNIGASVIMLLLFLYGYFILAGC